MRCTLGVLGLVAVGCAHTPVSASALDSLERPAFIARIEEGAGPKSVVFRDDAASYAKRLKTLDAREADRRLTLKLEKGTDKERSINRYQVADSLRAQVVSELPRTRPWTRMLPPAQVATVLESFLVDEVPANAPDVTRLEPLGVDSILEIVIEDYGMRSKGGKAGIYLYGYAQLYRVKGGVLYRRAFFSDELNAGLEHLDPFEVAKSPTLFANRVKSMLQAVAHQIALDLSPATRTAQQDTPPARLEAAPTPAKPAEEDPL
ncbi:MAG: hypothetical protein GQE15_22690 [Archangiaceae bacterium]|nr:hypothetical protein [Archangiaceae bacterium]